MTGTAVWYLSRGTGVTSLVLLTLVLVLGVVTRNARPLPGLPRFVTAGLHRNVSLLALVFLTVHVATAVSDPYAMTGLVDVVVPFHAGYRPLWVGLGTLALDLVVALVLTSLLRHRLPHRLWRTVHWAGYACWPLALVHGIRAGTDAGARWNVVVVVACAASAGLALGWRATASSFRTAQVTAR